MRQISTVIDFVKSLSRQSQTYSRQLTVRRKRRGILAHCTCGASTWGLSKDGGDARHFRRSSSSTRLTYWLLAAGPLFGHGLMETVEEIRGCEAAMTRHACPSLLFSSPVTARTTGGYAGAWCRALQCLGACSREAAQCGHSMAVMRQLHRPRRLGGYAGRWRPCDLPQCLVWNGVLNDKSPLRGTYTVNDECYVSHTGLLNQLGVSVGLKDFVNLPLDEFLFLGLKGMFGDLIVIVEQIELDGIIVPFINAISLMAEYLMQEIFVLPYFDVIVPEAFALRNPRRCMQSHVALGFRQSHSRGIVALEASRSSGSPTEVVFTSSRRIGEADNPGPFSVGGATSSGHVPLQGDNPPQSQPSWQMQGHGRWSQVQSQCQSVAGGSKVPERWPIPVICRDVNYLHQSETRLMHYDDIVPFLEDELYGLKWSRQHLEEVLEPIYASGRGVLDPAVLVPRDSWLYDCERYGWADAVPLPARPYSSLAPVSAPRPFDLLEQHLDKLQKRDPEAALARVLMKGAHGTCLPSEPQVIFLEQLLEPPCEEASFSHVGAAPPPQLRGHRSRRNDSRRQTFPGLPALQAAVGKELCVPRERVKREKRNLFDCVILNSSGRPQLMAAMMVSGGASVVIAQEHHSHGSSFVDLQHEAKAIGWTLVGAPAHRTQAEWASAGVCLAVKHGVGLGDVAGSFDLSPHAAPGRIAGAWVHLGPDSGMVILSVYLFHSEGASLRNKAILRQALAVAASYGSPWLIASDFNCEPEFVLSHWADGLEKANAYVVATEEPTHRPSVGVHRTLDFAICSHHVNDWISDAQVDLSFETAPHRAVRLRIRAEPHNYLVESMAGPRCIPKERPIGCPRKPLVPDWYDSASGCSALETGGYAGSHTKAYEATTSDSTLDPGGYTGSYTGARLWPSLVHAMEGELCRMHDLVDALGQAKGSYCGRGKRVATTQKLALPRRTSAALGKTCISAHALVWLSRRVKELADISAKVAVGQRLSEGSQKQWSSIMAKITAISGLPAIIDRISSAWSERMEVVRGHIPGRDTMALREIQQEALLVARDMKAGHLRNRLESWRTFARKQVLTGAAVAHRLIKRGESPCCDTATVGVGAARTSSPQAIVEKDLLSWREVWCRLGNQPSAPWRKGEVQSTMPLISAADVLKAASTFPKGTSIGCDAIPLAVLADLSEPLRDAIARLLNHLEREGSWPAEVSTALVHLIPKPSGGRRPIGVLPTLVRIWERIRKREVQKWAGATRRHYDWATQGRSAEAAAWNQSLFDEAAAADGLQTATVFLDLAKAFETIRLELVWQAGIQFGFPLDLLRLSLEAFAFERRLTYQSAISAPTNTLSAVLAGGGLAQVSMLLVLMRPLDRLWDGFQNQGLSLCAYVDDVALHFAGTSTAVASVAAQASEQLVQELEGELSMVVSRRQPWASSGPGKTVATATRGVASGFLTTMRRLGIIVQKKAKHLGVHFGPGGRTRDLSGRSSRWAAVIQRRARAVKLGRRLGGHVIRTGIQPSVLYGASVMLPKLGVIRGLRRLAARASGPVSGRSITARLAVGRCDPALQALKATMFAWFRNLWDCKHLHGYMARAWMFAQSTVSGSKRPSLSAGGAAGSFIAALSRVGWRSPSYHSVVTRDGTILNLLNVAPRTTLQYLVDDYAVVASAASDVVSRLTGGPTDQGGGYARWHAADDRYVKVDEKCIPWFEPAAAVLNSKWAREQSPEAVASVGAVLEGGWWPQERLFTANLAADPYCRACCTYVGTFLHRCLECPARRKLRDAACPEALQTAARLSSHDPLFSLGVPRRPACPPAPPEREYTVGQVPVQGALAVGHAYTDGAMRGVFSKAKRAGWAFIINDGTLPMWGKYGSIGDVYPSALRAELRALLEVLRHTAGGLTIHVDNQEVVDGISRGQGWCCASGREGADLWQNIWAMLLDLEDVLVVKVKAHLKFVRVLEGAISCHDWCGNSVADEWAKAGCEIASHASSCDWVHEQWTRATAWYRWLVRLAGDWVTDTARSGPCPQNVRDAPAVPTVRSSTEAAAATHELWRNSYNGWCRKCGITAKWSTGRPPQSFRRICRGTMDERCNLRGRQIAVPPSRGPSDDGAISFATLRAKGAVKVTHLRLDELAGDQLVAGGGAVTDATTTTPLHSHARPAGATEEDTGGDNEAGRVVVYPEGALEGSATSGLASGTAVEGLEDTPADSLAASAPRGSSTSATAHPSHELRKTGHIVWCSRCGRHAAVRLGSGLLQPCRGEASGAYPARIRRLKSGCHPVTGAPV